MLRDEVTNKTDLGVSAKKIMDQVRPSSNASLACMQADR